MYKRPLPAHLRKMPGEWVTTDISNDKRIHPLDPPHIVKHLARKALGEWAAATREKDPIKWAEVVVMAHFNAMRKHPARFNVIDQQLVDLYRALALVARAKRVLRHAPGFDQCGKLMHIWFNTANDGTMLQTRRGAEPPDSERPEFLRCLNLTIDLACWPPAFMDLLTTAGVDAKGLQDAVKAELVKIDNAGFVRTDA